jgi:endonuclease/exonuclease/phosphatase family metal-dependent hydrolase
MRILLLCAAAVSLWAQPLTVLSYNIRHGQGMDGRLDLERTAAVIRSVSPDVVALQEVDRRTSRSGGVDQAEELGRLTGMHAAFAKAIDYGGGEYGNAVLSKRPVVEFEVHPLPGQEPRALLEVRFEDFTFFATHLDVSRPETLREESARKIVEIVRERGDVPAVLAGDLNTVRGRETLQVLSGEWRIAGDDREQPTIPSGEPRRQIDFILFRPAEKWRVAEVRVIEEKVASDHRPIMAVLER